VTALKLDLFKAKIQPLLPLPPHATTTRIISRPTVQSTPTLSAKSQKSISCPFMMLDIDPECSAYFTTSIHCRFTIPDMRRWIDVAKPPQAGVHSSSTLYFRFFVLTSVVRSGQFYQAHIAGGDRLWVDGHG
jgi:hypothetical protein